MFVVRTCDEITRYSTHTHPPLIEMRACDDSTMTIEERGNTYTVTLPSGTEITFSTYYYWWMGHFISHIQIKPSILDVENSEGMCGRITNGNRNSADDFTLRDGSTLYPSYYNGYTFSRNWRVKENEQFFVDKPLVLSENINLRQYCICGDSTPERETFRCGLEAPLQSCLSQKAHAGNFHTTCSLLRRRRSLNGNGTVSATDSDDVIDNKQLVIEDDDELNGEIPPETNNEWPAGWTKNLAQSTCESQLKQEILEEALEVAHTSIDGYIKTCMSDIQLAGDTRFLQDTISTVRQTVYSEIVRNQSLFTNNNPNDTTSESTMSVAEMLLSGLCSNNCSQNGECQNGVCKCNTGFGKQDCSEDLSTPPSNISIPLNGICNTRERLCAKTNIQGVFSSRNITCLSRHFQIRNDGSWDYTSSQQMYAAEYKNTYLVACELPSSGRRKRSISTTIIADGYEINLSNDGTNFGEGVKIIIYDQDCFSCDIANLSCVSLDSCPDRLTSASQLSSTAIEGGGSSTTDTVSSTTTNAKTSTNIKTTRVPSTSTPFANLYMRSISIDKSKLHMNGRS
ncbi:serine-rich adhesin for platelets-like [Mytilus trossulus]|uniref:serine-rich adhesin for platelets-like n=1 Tax=Mytilus trossulus TaxID=6551 RepID=UPI00300752F8